MSNVEASESATAPSGGSARIDGKPLGKHMGLATFASIYARASERKGGDTVLEELLPHPASAKELAALADDRILAEMTKCVFRAGFVWQVVENKWPGFEAAFHQFDVARCAMLSDEELERLVTDESIIRNAKKIQGVRKNAAFILEVREEKGSFGRLLADWPGDDFVALWDELKKRGDRLGGQTGRFFLRFVGRDTPMFSKDVVAALVGLGVVDKEPTSKRALGAAQAAFNVWREESGRPFCQISRVLACSVDS